MAVDPKKLIAAISPDTYCSKKARGEVKGIIQESIKEVKSKIAQMKEEGRAIVEDDYQTDAYLKAAEKAQLAESDFMDFDEVIKTPFELKGLKNPIEQHIVSYDTSSQAIEQVYFWIHDYIQNNKQDYGDVIKLVDNFISAPGSAHFSEMGGRATKMQEEGMKILGVANQLIKAILQIIYDLKEFKMRLMVYDEYNDKTNASRSESARLSLKQIWLDQVDIKRGNSSIKALAISGANAPNFVMLIDAFMKVNSLKEIDEIDLNERVKRLLYQRFGDFERWIKESDRELRKRYEIEKIYLKSQVNNVKLYSKWAKPYLRAAAQLEQRASETSSLVSAFSTTLFELTLLGFGDYAPEKDIAKGDLPKVFKGKNKRGYAPVILVELKFRSIPERFQQQGGYGFRGKADIVFTSFSLNKEERQMLKDQLEWDDFKDVYRLIAGSTEESLGQMQSDINELLGESATSEKKKEPSSSEDTNPFAALFSGFSELFSRKSEVKKEGKEKKLSIEPDSDIEKIMRSQSGIEARIRCKKFYDSFKKSNNSPTF